MDKYEYKLKLEQIKNLVEAKDYKTAAKIADTINWKKVKNVSTLCMIGEIYEKTRQFPESQEVLLMAYDRSPVGRNIIYSLTLLAVKMGNLTEAQEYYEEFLEIAPHDNLKYVLRYEIAKARGAAPSELIAILEEFKEREYTEEWAYELAYLYHKNGNGEKCVELCDELVLWFGDGKYVEKALELKMLYQPLNKLQEEKYRSFKDGYNAINLQEELAKSMKQIAERQSAADAAEMPADAAEAPMERAEDAGEARESDIDSSLTEEYDGQIRLRVPETPERVPQITGQMRIEDILAEWEKTKEAARAAIAEAEQRRLEELKARELRKTEELKEQLEDQPPVEELAESEKTAAEPAESEMTAAEGTESMAEEQTETDIDIEEEDGDQEDEALIMQQLLKQQEQERKNREEQQLKREVTLEDDRELDMPLTKLSEKQKKIFTYFTLISGMEQQLCQALEGAHSRKYDSVTSAAGNLAIMGGKGSGKTVLATDFIKAYQQMNGVSRGKVGKISAAALNQKDITRLFEAVEGGYLIIERAGDLSRESVEKLSWLMDQDTKGLLVILEDDREGVEKVLSRNAGFSKKFTERIRIPIFTNDELVAFARAYAREQNCEIDDMGVLALYNSISNIQKLDEATTLTEVKEIMDDAIYRAVRGGLRKLFGGRRTTEDGLILIRERDFDV